MLDLYLMFDFKRRRSGHEATQLMMGRLKFDMGIPILTATTSLLAVYYTLIICFYSLRSRKSYHYCCTIIPTTFPPRCHCVWGRIYPHPSRIVAVPGSAFLQRGLGAISERRVLKETCYCLKYTRVRARARYMITERTDFRDDIIGVCVLDISLLHISITATREYSNITRV
jgi:hypothetical protein